MDAEKIYNELTEIKLSQVRMEDDIKYHIKRTDILEMEIKPIVHAFGIGKWVVAVVIGIFAVIKVAIEVLSLLKK